MLQPDRAEVHATLVGISRAGLVAVGLGHRAGEKEIIHLLTLTGAARAVHRSTRRPAARPPTWSPRCAPPASPSTTTSSSRPTACPARPAGPIDREQIGPDELFLLNSTSGTTGLPKCVMHTQNRWEYFHQLAVHAGELGDDEVFFGAVPAPFGFGLWTSHFTPTLLGAPTVVMERFHADAAARPHRVAAGHGARLREHAVHPDVERPGRARTRPVVAAVDVHRRRERAVRAGGRVRADDRRQGAAVLRVERDRRAQLHEHRPTPATTACAPPAGSSTTCRCACSTRRRRPTSPAPAMPGQPACKGPATCIGYWGDDGANQKLCTPDGWMLMGDIVTIDDDGYLRVVGRRQRLHHPRRQEHQRPGGRGRGRHPPRRRPGRRRRDARPGLR